jgi:hypothetical protein
VAEAQAPAQEGEGWEVKCAPNNSTKLDEIAAAGWEPFAAAGSDMSMHGCLRRPLL